MKKGVNMRHPGAVHPSIGSQAPPNNTQHIITTHFYHIHIFLHTKAAVKHLYSSLFPVENAVEKSCCRGPLQQLYSTHALSHGPISIQQLYSAVERCRALQLYSGSTVYRLYTLPLARVARAGQQTATGAAVANRRRDRASARIQ